MLAHELERLLRVVLWLLLLMRMFNTWVCHELFIVKVTTNTSSAMALVWLFSPQYPLALLPFGVYSVFHTATYTRTNLIPTLQPPQQIPGTAAGAKPTFKPSALSDTIGKFVKEYYDTSMGLVAILEIFIWFRLLLSAIIFTKGSWILIAIYTAFLRARFAQSSFVQGQFRQISARVDSLVGAQSTPPVARQVWGTIKNGAVTFRDVTDVSRYLGGKGPAAAAAPRKAQ